MALANYTGLLAAIAAALPRADLTATIPDFVLMAEAEFNRKLRTQQQEVKANLTVTGEYVTVPVDFMEFRNGYIASSPRRPLAYLSPDLQTGTDGDPRSGGKVHFSLAGGSFRFYPPPSPLPVDAVILYYAKITPLASNATNWLLTAHPDLYKYASLFFGAVEAQDEKLAQAMKSLYESIIEEVNAAARRNRWGGPGMVMRAA